jgi:hypothetical protein
MDTAELISRVSPAVVTLICFDGTGQQTSQGSGFIVAPDGIIATACHVLVGAIRADVRLSIGAHYEVAGTVQRDAAADFALLKVPGTGLPTIPLGDSDTVRQGARVVALGAPLGLEETASEGIVSAVREWPQLGRVLQLTAPISPGSSGGPVLNDEGEAVGIVSFLMWQGQNLNFAVPINAVKLALQDRAAVTPVADVPAPEMEPSAPKVITAQAFQVVDSDGRPRAALMVGPDGNPALMLNDTDDNVRLGVSLVEDGTPNVGLCDKGGTIRLDLKLAADGTPLLASFDKAGALRTTLMVADDGNPSLTFNDMDGNVRLGLSLAEDGTPFVGLSDKGQFPSLLLTVSEGMPQLVMQDRHGARRAALILGGDGCVSLWLYDANETIRLSLMLYADGTPRLFSFDKNGKVRAGWP